MIPDDKFAIFIPLWLAMGAATALLLWRGSYQAKKTWAPRMVVLAGLLFLGFIYWSQGAGRSFYFAAPGVVVITVLNVWGMRFCPQCSAYNRRFGTFGSGNFCSRCGHDLDGHGNI